MKRLTQRVVLCVAMTFVCATLLSAQTPDGATLYRVHCSSCHDAGLDRAPSRDGFREMVPERVLAAMESGPMITMAVRLAAPERRAVAEFVTGKPFSQAFSTTPKPEAMCGSSSSGFNPRSGPRWESWGANASNTRLQTASMAGLSAADVGRLKVKWAFGFPGDMMAYAQPSVAGGRVFVGSQGGKVYALNAATGCVHWFVEAAAPVRAAVVIARIDTASGARDAAIFGDQVGNLYAVDAATGALLWKTKLDDFPTARVTGSPVFHKGRIYVGLASGEETSAAVPDYECCRFRGSLVAVNATTGKQVWKTYMIPEDPLPTKTNKAGKQMWGPSGAPILDDAGD
jgi:polyvinyl alcohol dehydrogenase (cytochrome)